MLSIRNLTLAIGGRVLLQDFSLDIAPGQVCALMGPSGVGKSTLLHWLIGDLDPAMQAHGQAWLHGRRIDTLPTERRGIGILFQDDLLFPHLSVGRNLAFALPAQASAPDGRRALVEQVLADIGLRGCHDRDPASLSGGQRARVSVMRALLAEPAALLLDEPFSRLDATLRAQFRAFVFERARARHIPVLLVTHDAQDVPPEAVAIHLAHPAAPADEVGG